MDMTECYRYAVDTYAQMTEDEKAKISLELLYNAICYYHGDAEEIVQKLLRMDQPALSKLGKSLADMRRHVKKLHQATLAAMPASINWLHTLCAYSAGTVIMPILIFCSLQN